MFLRRKRRVAELFTELFGGSFLPFPYLAAVDHHIMCIALALDLDLAKFDQSCFHFAMFLWLELQGNETRMLRAFGPVCPREDKQESARCRLIIVRQRTSRTTVFHS